MSVLERHLNNLYDSKFRKSARAKGVKVTGGPNACAATASQYYIALGIIDKVYVNTQQLVNALLAANKFDKRALKSAKPGDLVVTIDDPKDTDTWPEHVWHLYGFNYPAKSKQGCCQNGYGWAVDNYSNSPYPRNITAPGPKTRAAYVLRLKV